MTIEQYANENSRDKLSYRYAVLHSLANLINKVASLITAIGTPTEAVFDEYATLAHSGISGTYAALGDLADSTKSIIFANNTNGDVVVSMDAGNTDHFYIRASQTLSLPLKEANLKSTATVHVKDGTIASSGGTFYMMSYR